MCRTAIGGWMRADVIRQSPRAGANEDRFGLVGDRPRGGMEDEMTKLSPEIEADVRRIMGRPKAKAKPAKLVAEAGRVVAEAEVEVSPRDPNYREGPRPGFVTINVEAFEQQWRADRGAEEWNREDAARRQRESFGLNLYPRGRY